MDGKGPALQPAAVIRTDERVTANKKTAGNGASGCDDALALDLTKTMVHQMEALFRANLSYPAEFDRPLHRLVLERTAREPG